MGGEWIDVSVPVRPGMVHWPDDGPVRFAPASRISKGDEANLTRMDMSAHTGTHMDAPLHFIAEGEAMEDAPLDVLLGEARVVAIEGEEPIDRGHVEELDLREGERIL